MDRKYPNALAYIKIEAVIRVKQKLWAVKIWAKMIWKQPSSLAVCLTGNEIDKAYSNMGIDRSTLYLVLFYDTFEFGAVICRSSREVLNR